MRIIAELKNELPIRANTADSLFRDKELAKALANHLSEAQDDTLTQLRKLQGLLDSILLEAQHVHQLHSEILQKSEMNMNMELAHVKEKLEEKNHQFFLLLHESKKKKRID